MCFCVIFWIYGNKWYIYCMAKIIEKETTSETVKLSTDAVDIARKVKEITGVGISRFIVEAIHEKAMRLPKKHRVIIFPELGK